MWRIKKYYSKGSKNLKMGLKCQDYVFGIEDKGNGNYAIALADGSGNDNMAYYGAKLAAETLAEIMLEIIKNKISDEEEIRMNVKNGIRQKLIELCKENDCDLDQVHSTLLGVAVDENDERFIAVHLGDGVIYYEKFDEGSEKIMSHPDNGVNRYYTYLTSMIDPGKHLRVYTGNLNDINGFILMSDGWKNNNEDNIKLLIDMETDDVSLIELIKLGEYN